MTATQEQLAALAALVGITPNTHKQFVWDTSSGTNVNVSGYPDPLAPDADGVWAVPFIYWLRDNARDPTVCEYLRGWKAYVMNDESEHIRGYANTMTAALLQACLAASVPEVCAILETHHA